MDNTFLLITNELINKLATTEVMNCNEITYQYGLILSETEAQELVETRTEALNSNGRVEFAGGIIKKMIIEFSDSPYLSQYNYSETLNELIETFYYFKNETMDKISDDDLISFMKEHFDHSCQGSVEQLQSKELEILAHNLRFGINNDIGLNEDTDSDDDFDDTDYLDEED